MVLTVFLVIKFLKNYSHLLKDNSSVIFFGSISASAGSFDEVYSAAKSSLYGLTKSLAKKSERGIRYNCISPGLIADSNMSKMFTSLEMEKHIAETPIKKLVSKKYLAHDAGNTIAVGENVKIQETKPLSKHKSWEIIK